MKYAFLLTVFMASCAQLHHVQLGEVRDSKGDFRTIEIKVSETGVDLQEAKEIAKIFMRSQKAKDTADDIMATVGLFQMGPRTGNPVYVESYTQKLPEMIRAECPSGKISGITSVRETRKYPVISGEIVKVIAFCGRE